MKLQIFTIMKCLNQASYTCLAVILIDFVLKEDNNYYPQVLLKERQYIEQEKSDQTYY